MSMLKGTYKKRNFSPSVYSLVFEPTTSAEALTEAIQSMLADRKTTLYIRDRQYTVDSIRHTKTQVIITIENVIIRWESYPQDTTSALELEMARFEKVKPKDYDSMKVIPFRYCSNLSRGGRENQGQCGQRLLIERIQETKE